MAKSKSRRETKKNSAKAVNWGGQAAGSSRRIDLAVGLAVLAMLIAGGLYWWGNFQSAGDFETLAAQGQAALQRVKTTPGGGGHLEPGQTQVYAQRFPTSGRHDPVPLDPGFYEQTQPATKLVHSIEHGHIVIYFDSPGAEAVQHLRDWTALYSGHWDGVIATPAAGLRKVVVLTAWHNSLRLTEFDPAAAAAFIDKFRGRGPENPVR
jgi:hypothetical protein